MGSIKILNWWFKIFCVNFKHIFLPFGFIWDIFPKVRDTNGAFLEQAIFIVQGGFMANLGTNLLGNKYVGRRKFHPLGWNNQGQLNSCFGL